MQARACFFQRPEILGWGSEGVNEGFTCVVLTLVMTSMVTYVIPRVHTETRAAYT